MRVLTASNAVASLRLRACGDLSPYAMEAGGVFVLVALAVLAAIEAAAPPTVELTLSASHGAPVSATPRSLSDVARELREGRKAVGGFSAVETTVSRGPIVLPAVEWDEEETRSEPEVVPEPQPPGWVVTDASGWTGGWYGGGRQRRPPYVRHHLRSPASPATRPDPRLSPRAGAPRVSRSTARPVSPRAVPPVAAPGHVGRRS